MEGKYEKGSLKQTDRVKCALVSTGLRQGGMPGFLRIRLQSLGS